MTERKQYLDFGMQEVKFAADAMTFDGYGAVFGNKDSYGDVIEPGAFAKTLSESKRTGQWPMMLLQHGGMGLTADDMTPIGIWTDLAEDGKGLRVVGKLADTTRAREIHALMKMDPRPAINGLSIGYYARKFTVGTKPSEPRRKLEQVDLVEVSIVTNPANAKARVDQVKSIEEIMSLREAEDYLRDAGGLSRTEAKSFLTRLMRLGQRDADGGMQELMDAVKRRGKALAA